MMRRTWWNIGRAAALLLVSMNVSCTLDVTGLGLAQPPDPEPNAYTCSCTCKGDPYNINPTFNVCVPDTLNTNKPGGQAASLTAIQADCQNRVVPNYTDTIFACLGKDLAPPVIVLPEDCSCDVQPATFVAECNDTCGAEPVNCSTLDPRDPSTLQGTVPPGTANAVPVCEVSSGPSSAPSGFSSGPSALTATQTLSSPEPLPLAARLFGQRSRCEIEPALSSAIVTLDSDAQPSPLSGVVEFLGAPCPGTGCTVGMAYQLAVDTPFNFSSFCSGTTISDVQAFGSASQAVDLDAQGVGQIPPEQTFTSARGTRTDSGLCITDRQLQMSFIGTNAKPIGVTVDWNQKTCAVTGTLLGATVENNHALSVAVSLRGTLMNQPPTANAGADQTVECTAPHGAPITLDGTGSRDPDNSTLRAVWRQGNRTGTPVGQALTVTLSQGVGTTGQYVLQVLDAQGQLDEDTTSVRVADTTAPQLTAVTATPRVLQPPNHTLVPVTVTVSAQDSCDPTPDCQLMAVTSNEPVNGTGDGDMAPDWQITGPLTVNLRAERAGNGSGRVYTLTTECKDATGNRAQGTTTVTVPH